MKMREIARKVQLAQDIYEDRTIRNAVQRVLGEERVKTEIVGYLARRPDRFFSSIVVAAMEGEPTWHPVEMDTSTVPKIFTSSSSMRDSFGVLSFGDEPKYYALDGQHRVAAIKLLIDRQAEIEAPSGFDDDLLSVIVVLREEHNVPEGEWIRRYRRLFSSLNRYAKPTDRDTNIIMDEDDLFAIVTRRLITDHEFFQAPGLERESFKVLTRGKNLKAGTSHFTTLQTLYAINTTLLKTSRRQMLGWDHGESTSGDLNRQIRPDEEYIDGYYEELSTYWDAIRETSADYRKLRLGIGELIRPLLLDPPELKELYPFQRQGAEWLSDQRGAILADDMGLGKTVQAIAAMRLLFNRAMLRNALVVCPKGLVAT